MKAYKPTGKATLSQDEIDNIINTGNRICRIYYKVVDGFLFMVSIDEIIASDILSGEVFRGPLAIHQPRRHSKASRPRRRNGSGFPSSPVL